MSLVLQSSGGGSVTIAEPSTASNFTATLPAGTGTIAVQGASSNIVSGTAVASTSGTSIDFTGIPSWVKRITVMFNGVSTNGGSFVIVQLGTPTFTTSGYVGGAFNGGQTAFSSGFIASQAGGAADLRSGIATICNLTGNTWVASGATGVNVGGGSLFGGTVTLGAALTSIRVTTVNGTDAFDAGSINILYE